MLIEIGYYRSEGSMGVLNLADNSVQSLSSPQGYVCCSPAWAPDSRNIYYANAVDGIVPPGLWRTDVTTGEGETLIDGIAKDAILSVANAFPTADDNLYYFYAVTKAPSDPGQSVPLSMYRAQSAGVTDQTQLRSDAHVVGEALWATDAGLQPYSETTNAAHADQHFMVRCAPVVQSSFVDFWPNGRPTRGMCQQFETLVFRI